MAETGSTDHQNGWSYSLPNRTSGAQLLSTCMVRPSVPQAHHLLQKSDKNRELTFCSYLSLCRKVIILACVLRGELSGLKIAFEASTFDPTNDLVLKLTHTWWALKLSTRLIRKLQKILIYIWVGIRGLNPKARAHTQSLFECAST